MHLTATAKPSTEGTAPIQRQGATPIGSTRNSNHDGSNQNHSAKKEVPTASEANVASHCFPGFVTCEAPACPLLISSPVASYGEFTTTLLQLSALLSNKSYVRERHRLHSFLRLANTAEVGLHGF